MSFFGKLNHQVNENTKFSDLNIFYEMTVDKSFEKSIRNVIFFKFFIEIHKSVKT